jgi:tetratricopeptide (TPR) repeat protein
MFDETRFDGSLFTLLALAPIAWTGYKLQINLLTGSKWFGMAVVVAIVPLFINPEFSVSMSSALSGLADRAPLLGALVLAGCMRQWSQLNQWQTMLPLFVATAAACLFTIPQALGWDPPGYLNLLGRRPLYPFLGLNHAGEIVTPTLLLTVTLGSKYRNNKLVLLALPMALACGFWGGNAIRLGLLLGLAALYFISRVNLKPIILISVAFAIGEMFRATTTGGFKSIESEFHSTAVRLEMYSAAIEKSVVTPQGIGLGQFEHSYPQWRSQQEVALTKSNISNGGFKAPKTLHNDFLQALLEFGWLGFVLLIVGCRSLFKNIFIHRDANDLLLFSGFFVAYGVCAFTRSPLNDNLVAMAILMLVLASLDRQQPNPSKSKPNTLNNLLAAALCMFSLFPTYQNLRGEQLIAAAIDDEERTFEYISQATEVRPWDSRTWVMMGAMYSISGQYDYSRTCFDQALSYHPYDLSALLGAIKLEQLDPQGSTARMLLHLETAEKLVPSHQEVVELRLRLLEPQLEAAEQAAAKLMRSGNGKARRYWLAAELIRAQIFVVKQDPSKARAALLSAAEFSDGKRALIERVAKKDELSRQLLTQLILEVFPSWPLIN